MGMRIKLLVFMFVLLFLPAASMADARPDGKKGLYPCSSLAGGTPGALDALDIIATGAPNAYDLVDGDLAMVGNNADGWNFYVFNAAATNETSVPDYIRPLDYATAGVWVRDTSMDAPTLPVTHWFTIAQGSPAEGFTRLLFSAAEAHTATKIHCIVDPSDTGESVVVDILKCDTSGDNCASIGQTTCDNDGAENTSLTDPSITTGQYLRYTIGTVTGSVSELVVEVD